MKDVSVVFSGGIDSTTALAMAAHQYGYWNVQAISFSYDQRHRIELEAAKLIAEVMGVEHHLIDARGLVSGGALIGRDGIIPRGPYAAENMQRTEVHGRNLLFASIALARTNPGGTVILGVHGGDHHIYPDCRPAFWDPLIEAAASAYGIDIQVPFLNKPKDHIIKIAQLLDAPLHMSYSCYEGAPAHCGECATCLERIAAFEAAGADDPTVYEIQ